MIRFALKRLLASTPMFIGVTFLSFVLMVYFGPDLTFTKLGKNPSPEDIARVRELLGYNDPFFIRYLKFIKEVLTFDFGSSSNGENVMEIIKRTMPITFMSNFPAFIIGNVLGIAIALFAAYFRGTWIDRTVMGFSIIGLSISFLVVVIGFQILFCSYYGLDWFPVTGWSTETIKDYLKFVTVPTLASVFVSLGYNTRFYRSIFVEEISKDHVRTAKAYGATAFEILTQNVLRNTLVAITTRIIITIPFIFIAGSLIIESYFQIPGIGQVTYDALQSGDIQVVKALVVLTAIGYILALILTDIVYSIVDPRIKNQ